MSKDRKQSLRTTFKQMAFRQLDMGEVDHVCTILLPLKKRTWTWFAEYIARPQTVDGKKDGEPTGRWNVYKRSPIYINHFSKQYKWPKDDQLLREGVELPEAMKLLKQYEAAWKISNLHTRITRWSVPSNHFSKVRQSLLKDHETKATRLTAASMAKRRQQKSRSKPSG